MKKIVVEILQLVWKVLRLYVWKWVRPYLGKILFLGFVVVAATTLLFMMLVAAAC